MMQAIEYLKRSPLLADVCEEDLRNIQPPPEIIKLAAGEILMRQGDTDCDYYLLLEGRLTVIVRDTEGTVVARGGVHPGEGVGEMAMMMNEPRSATVTARLDSTVLRFRQASFLNLLDSNPRALKAIARLTMRRLKEQYTVRKEVYPAITVFPLDLGIDAAALTRDLAAQLSAMGRAESVLPGSFGLDVSSGPGFDQEAKLAEIESRNRHTLYCSAGRNDAWSRYLLQRSDLILLCVRAGSEPQPDQLGIEVLKKLDLQPPRQIRPPDRAPAGLGSAGAELKAGSPGFPISRAPPCPERKSSRDLARVARIMAGTANNLVLGGGGRQVVFPTWIAARVRPKPECQSTRAAGSSMGAFVAALHCYGGDLEGAPPHHAQGIPLRRRPDRDYTPCLCSLSLAANASPRLGNRYAGNGGSRTSPVPLLLALRRSWRSGAGGALGRSRLDGIAGQRLSPGCGAAVSGQGPGAG